MIAGVDSSIVNIVHNVIGVYTIDNIMDGREAIRQEILKQLWGMFDNTTFIYNVNILITPA